MKIRNIIIILVLNYLTLLIVSSIIELAALSTKAENVQMTMRTAADMALEQTQVIDEYMAYNGRAAYSLKMPSSYGTGFIPVDMFEGVYGLNSTQDGKKKEIFETLYNNDFKMLALRLAPMKKPVRYWNIARTNFVWYYAPSVAMMGRNMLPRERSIDEITDLYGNAIPQSLANEIFSVYGYDPYVKTSGGKEYYNTPVNLGITYLNEELLGTLFMNNIDLLMRQKYKANLNTPEGGNGVLTGSTYVASIKGDLSAQNPINNGEFTVLRGTQKPAVLSVKSFLGVKPQVLYKVIDMYDSANDNLLIELLGPNKGGFGTKAEYLKDLDKDTRNPATNSPYTTKPFVVAKVTFYLDVIIPYYTLLMRELRANVGNTDSNFIDLQDEKKSGVGGTKRISYTRYFSITP
jgi:hypothetical protein